MTGMVPYKSLNVADPLALAVREAGGRSTGSRRSSRRRRWSASPRRCSSPSTGRRASSCGCPRTACSPTAFGRVSERFQTPTTATVVCAVAGAAVAALLPIDVLGELVSIGTLLSFLIVCAGVLVLRRTRPDLERPFRVKGVWFVAPLGIFFALALMVTLPVTTWIRLAVWLAIGLVIYFFYAAAADRRADGSPRRDGGGEPRARSLVAAPPSAVPEPGLVAVCPWLVRARIAIPTIVAASAPSVAATPAGVSCSDSSISVVAITTLVIGSSAIIAARAGARTPAVSASWLNVIEM